MNRKFFGRLGIERTGINFAYPYGCVSPRVKRHLRYKFISVRGIQNKLNRGNLDLSLLCGLPLFKQLWTENSLAAIIERTVATAAWCIFFAHGVSESPDEFGVTPALLDFAVRHSRQAGCSVLPVKNALGLVGFRPHANP